MKWDTESYPMLVMLDRLSVLVPRDLDIVRVVYHLYFHTLDLKHSGALDSVSGRFSICVISILIFTSRLHFLPCFSPCQNQREDPA